MAFDLVSFLTSTLLLGFSADFFPFDFDLLSFFWLSALFLAYLASFSLLLASSFSRLAASFCSLIFFNLASLILIFCSRSSCLLCSVSSLFSALFFCLSSSLCNLLCLALLSLVMPYFLRIFSLSSFSWSWYFLSLSSYYPILSELSMLRLRSLFSFSYSSSYFFFSFSLRFFQSFLTILLISDELVFLCSLEYWAYLFLTNLA